MHLVVRGVLRASRLETGAGEHDVPLVHPDLRYVLPAGHPSHRPGQQRQECQDAERQDDGDGRLERHRSRDRAEGEECCPHDGGAPSDSGGPPFPFPRRGQPKSAQGDEDGQSPDQQEPSQEQVHVDAPSCLSSLLRLAATTR